MDSESIKILHDHYKESFSHICSLEKNRDRFYIIVILIVGALFLQVQFPLNIKGALKNVTVQDISLDLSLIPLASLLNITWTLFLVFSLRYCQAAINIERAYEYLHLLESKISSILNDKEVYVREGYAYLNNYPVFSKWVWLFYTILFPIIILLAIFILLKTELWGLQYPTLHFLYDATIAIGVSLSYVLYRFIPLIKKKK